MSEKFIKYKYITAAGGKENGRNRSYRYFNYICGRQEKAGGDSENGDLRKQLCIFAEVMSTMKIMPGQKNVGVGFGLFAGKVQDGNFQEFQRENEEQY